MKHQKFIINHRFLIDPFLNTCADQQTGKETRLEPRLMNVLSFLVSSVNQLVTRETLIKEVWNDYGGGDEGLNQAVSFLRKLLGDTDKKIIETVPTKGYILRAVISEAQIVSTRRSNRQRNFLIVSVILVIIVTALCLLFWRSSDIRNNIPQPSIKVKVNPKITIKRERQIEPRPTLPPREEDSLGH